jgi:hypothetical protein
MKIILYPEGSVVDSEHTHTHQTWFLMSTDCSVKGAHLQYVDSTVIHKIALTEDNQLDTDVLAISSDAYVTDCHKVPWEPSVGTVQMHV